MLVPAGVQGRAGVTAAWSDLEAWIRDEADLASFDGSMVGGSRGSVLGSACFPQVRRGSPRPSWSHLDDITRRSRVSELLDDDAINGRWVLLLQGDEALIVKPYLVERKTDGASVQFVFGHGGQLVKGDRYSLHATLDEALAALRAARNGARVEGSVVIHSEGEVEFATDGFRM